MKNILTTAAFIFLLQAPSHSQYMDLDSLLNGLPQYKNPDTSRLNLLNNIAFNYHNSNPKKGLETGFEALILANKLNYKAKTALAFNNIGVNYLPLGSLDSAKIYFLNALKLYNEINHTHGKASTLKNIGICYHYAGDYVKAFDYYQQTLDISLKTKNDELMAATYSTMAVCLVATSNYPRAVEYYLKAITIFERMNNRAGLVNAYLNIGQAYRFLNRYDKTIHYSQKCYALATSIKDTRSQCYALGGIGQMYMYMNRFSEAIESSKKALLISEQAPYPDASAQIYATLGNVCIRMSDYSGAYVWLNKAKETLEKISDKNSLAIVLEALGNVYLDAPQKFLDNIGVTANNRYNKAIEMANKCLLLGKETNSPDRQSVALAALSKIYERKKDYEKALEYYKEAIAMQDTIFNAEKKTEIVQKEMQFEFSKKEALTKAEADKQQALAQAEIKRQNVIKNSVMSGAGILMLSSAFSFLFYKRRRDAEKQKIESDLKAEISDVEMKALRSQMNPHFIFNSLNSISEFVMKNDNKSADSYLSKFAKVMRMILENSQDKEVALASDLHVLELYMQLEALRMNHKFNYEINVDPSIDRDNTLIPPLILQPFVENSIWHGIAKKDGIGKIRISITKENDMLKCTVEDNGVGRIYSASKVGKKSLGMKITNERIQLINKLKKSKAAIALTDLAQGLLVEVTLPLETNF